MTDLVNICAPADAPEGAPLLFSRDAPGHCRWGTREAAAAITAVEAVPYDDSAAVARVAVLEQQVQQLIAHVRQLEADYQALASNLVDHTHETIRQVA